MHGDHRGFEFLLKRSDSESCELHWIHCRSQELGICVKHAIEKRDGLAIHPLHACDSRVLTTSYQDISNTPMCRLVTFCSNYVCVGSQRNDAALTSPHNHVLVPSRCTTVPTSRNPEIHCIIQTYIVSSCSVRSDSN